MSNKVLNILSESEGEERTGGKVTETRVVGEGERSGRRGRGQGGASHANTDHDHHVGRI